MTAPERTQVAGIALAALAGFWAIGVYAAPDRAPLADDEEAAATADLPRSAADARGRARLLHDTIEGVLQVIHRDFFSDVRPRAIPSHSLEDVFKELAEGQGVTLRWLVVNADAMNVDHKPRDDFERDAVRALAAGKREFELADATLYRHAGVIRLRNQCLKCHVPNRTSLEDRAAGLVILMPIKPAEPPAER